MTDTYTRDRKGKFRPAPRELTLVDRQGEIAKVLVGLREESVLYVERSNNKKTDDMPQQIIGATKEESIGTCQGCPLWKDRTCYSQCGISAIGFNETRKAVARGKDKSVRNALKRRNKRARYGRFGSIGDPGSIAEDVYFDHDTQFRAEGLGVLSYTHQWHWQHASFLKGKALASCDNWKDVVDSTNDGWRAAIHVDKDKNAIFNGKTILEAPQGEIDGKKYFLCPAQRKEFLGGREAFCNDCGLCDGEKKTNVDAIVFIQHGSCMKMKKEREAKQNLVQIEWD